MIVEIKLPSPGESITEVEIATWMVEDGDIVEKDQEVAEIESDKATLPLMAEEGGKIKILEEAGATVMVGAVVCTIDTSFAGEIVKKEKKTETVEKVEVPAKVSADEKPSVKSESSDYDKVKMSPVARKMMEENNLNVDDIINGLKRLGKNEVKAVVNAAGSMKSMPEMSSTEVNRDIDRQKMSSLRKKLSKRLVAVKNETAMLSTFNEVDMTAIMEIRKKFQKRFVESHGIKLGFMSFFTKAVSLALKLHPNVNAMIDGEEILYHNYSDVGIAVQTPKGLMVPVLRNTESLSLAGIEKNIMALADKARKGRISLDDMAGGTFTITNGGVFGSLLSTPIINPPQSAILGMHNIVERPVAINGKVEVRPMMYIALSYDHRVIDGSDSVGFLVKVKNFIEDPYTMLLGGQNKDALLMEI